MDYNNLPTTQFKDIERVLMMTTDSVVEKRFTMQMNPYLSFKGECEAAFKLYQQCLVGQPGSSFRYAGSPLSDQVPAHWQDKVMHGSLTIGDQTLMGAVVAPDQYEEPQG